MKWRLIVVLAWLAGSSPLVAAETLPPCSPDQVDMVARHDRIVLHEAISRSA